MKKLLIGLLALSSFSSFANSEDVNCTFYFTQDSIAKNRIANQLERLGYSRVENRHMAKYRVVSDTYDSTTNGGVVRVSSVEIYDIDKKKLFFQSAAHAGLPIRNFGPVLKDMEINMEYCK